MNNMRNNRIIGAVMGVVVVVVVILLVRSQPAQAQRDAAPASYPRYSVLDTEGHNLIVTDNKTQTVYFYTIDKEAKLGSDLKLRGSIDLKQVGKPVIKPTKAGATE